MGEPACQPQMMRPVSGDQAEDIPLVERPDGTRIRVIAGEVDGVRGPVTEVLADPTYLDVTVPLGVTARFPSRQGIPPLCMSSAGRGG